MLIAVRGGHNFLAKGAAALIDETVEDRKVYASTIKYLREAGHQVIDVTPGDCDVNSDLRYGVNKAEANGVDLFISIHFDKAYDSYQGSLGTGTWISARGGQAEKYATRIVNSIANGTGLVNRGVKTNPKLYELRKTSMPAVIVEVCFCEATKDVAIYKEKGPDCIGRLIAEGICNQTISSSAPVQEETPAEKPAETPSTSSKNDFLSKTNAVARVNLDPRDVPSGTYTDLGEIYANESVRILPEVCDKKWFLPITYWKDPSNSESGKVWVNCNQSYLRLKTNATVYNVVTTLDARYTPSGSSKLMGYVKNGETLYVHKIEGGYALATYFSGAGYKTAWFTAKYIKM